MKKVVLLFSAVVLFAGLTFAQTPQTQDKAAKSGDKKECSKDEKAGCDKKTTASKQLDKVQQKTSEVARDMKDYTYTQKAEFIETMRTQLADLNRELDQLAAKIEKSSDAVKADAQPKIDALRKQTTRLNKQLDEATDATESGWDALKVDVRKTYDASKEDFKQARQWLSDKIAP